MARSGRASPLPAEGSPSAIYFAPVGDDELKQSRGDVKTSIPSCQRFLNNAITCPQLSREPIKKNTIS
jgi:hypothetical protein